MCCNSCDLPQGGALTRKKGRLLHSCCKITATPLLGNECVKDFHGLY